ncbi:HEPN-associated N-terminal domain-containing protein [Citromicrobium bathyomarinum]
MSFSDPECYPHLHQGNQRVCSSCFEDPDLREFIRSANVYSECDFCGARRAKTEALEEVVALISGRVDQFFGRAVDQLPYESAEGGYQDSNWDTYDLLTDYIGLELPRDRNDALLHAIADGLGDEAWCAYDWTQLEYDESLSFSWRQFSEIVMHRRRFFFHNIDDTGGGDPDSRSPFQLLDEIANLAKSYGCIKNVNAGSNYYRARPRMKGEHHETPEELGPPPERLALQANRMNPPGIPMFYVADRKTLALREINSQRCSLATFQSLKNISVLDLCDLPPIPGFFSDASRRNTQLISFLHDFSRQISRPVPRDERVHVDYLPTQVFTEYLRDFEFDGSKISGIRYPTSHPSRGSNFVFFTTQDGIEQDDYGDPFFFSPRDPLFRLTKVEQRSAK